MTTVEDIERVSRLNENDEPPRMIHYGDPERGFPWALCGTRCRKQLPPGNEIDCVVCAELVKQRKGT